MIAAILIMAAFTYSNLEIVFPMEAWILVGLGATAEFVIGLLKD